MTTETLHPGRLFGLASGYWQPCALQAGVKLEIFTALAGKTCSVAELAGRLAASPRGLELLLNALTAMALLEKAGGGYRNSPLAEAYLDRHKPDDYVGHIVMHHHYLVEGWSRLDEAVMTGQPVETRSHGEANERESFQMGMFNLAKAIAPAISASIDLSGRGHLLDLGGGPGTHAVHFCLANPELRATVFDRATTRPFAEKIASRYGVADRVDFVAGDFHRDPIPGRYDVAWLSQILHSNTPEECQALINKTAGAMAPGGLMLIHDFFLDDDRAGPLFPALFSLNMLINNQGRSYSELETREMMGAAGLTDIRRLGLRGGNDSGILAGVKL
ncbi:MAG TPA: methyltransferase [Desulfurivibrionaceae bacterium]|nr:methyltransferase [Desulfurivibrionaceae bacterium]